MNNFEKIKNIETIEQMYSVLNYIHFMIFTGAGGFDLKQWLESEEE